MKIKICILALLTSTISAMSQSVGGVLSTNTVVCAGQNSGVLTLSSYTGSILRWEIASGPGGPWSAVMINTNTYSYLNLTQTTYFRAVVQASGFAQAISNYVSVACDAQSVAGTINGNTLQCISLNHTASLTGNTGTTITWEKTTTNWILTSTLSPNSTYLTGTYNTVTKVRARVKNGSCSAALSNTITITPAIGSNAGQVTGTGTVCAGSNTPTLAINNYTGNVNGWETSTNVHGPWNLVSQSQNLTSFALQNISQSTYFRVNVANANCPAVYSNTFEISVHQLPVAGQISGTYSVCAGSNTVNLQLTGANGQLLSWESSTNSGGSWNPISGTNTVVSLTNLTNTTIYRTKVKNGICPAITSPVHTVSAISLPTVTFQISNGCVGTQLSLINNCSGANGFFWDFGNGTSSSNNVPQLAYSSPGSYVIKLHATNSFGCADTAKTAVTIHPKPAIWFINQDSTCFGNAVLFTNATSISSGGIQQTNIKFGDGVAQSFAAQSIHHYLSEGTYKSIVTATSNHGCSDSLSKTVIILPKPKTQFLINNACEGATISPSNISSINQGNLQYNWDFGNSFNSKDHSPKIIYSKSGSYTVSLIATSPYSCSDTSFRPVQIHPTPTLNLASSPTCHGHNTSFTVNSSMTNQSTASQINYGDGTIGTTINAPHRYEFPGFYHVQAKITSDSGCAASSSLYVTVHPTPVAEFLIKPGCTGTAVDISNMSYISKGSLLSNWNTVNGLQQKHNPAIHFNTAGVFTVSLIVISENECSDTAVKQTISYPLPDVSFEVQNTCHGLVSSLHNKTQVNTGSIIEYKWNFSDNTASSIENPDKLFLNNGEYKISLVAISDHHCSDTSVKTIQILEAPIANFSAPDRCLGEKTRFENKSILKSATLFSQWEFSGAAKSEDNSPEFLFEKPGSYEVKLKVRTSDNCVDSISRWVNVFSLPVVSAGEDVIVEKGEEIHLKASGALSYNWFPGSKLNNPVIFNPTLRAEQSEVYFVLGTNENGCTSTDTVRVDVNEGFVVTPYNILTPNANGLNDTWKIQNIEAYPENHVVVVSQSNEIVYEQDHYKNLWDGKNMNGELLPESTYFYILTFKNSNKKYSGFITLIRN